MGCTGCEKRGKWLAALLAGDPDRQRRPTLKAATIDDRAQPNGPAPPGLNYRHVGDRTDVMIGPNGDELRGGRYQTGQGQRALGQYLTYGAMYAHTRLRMAVVEVKQRFPEQPVGYGRQLPIRPALDVARYRMTAVSDEEIYATAATRVRARLKR